MAINYIEKVLTAHSIPYYIENNQIFADSMIAFTAQFEKVENVTNWTKKNLFCWLGY